MGIISQELNLQNVELNFSSIEEDLGIHLPVSVKSAFARSLRIVIPWTSLLSLPIGVYIENLDIQIEDKVLTVQCRYGLGRGSKTTRRLHYS